MAKEEKVFIYSVRRARKILLDAIRMEVNQSPFISRPSVVLNREAAIRGLIAAVRAEAKP